MIQLNRPQPKPAPQAAERMTLANVKSGRLQKPPRIVLYGVEKIGKSTTAAGAPSPIFIGAEDGTSELDVARFPEPRSWPDILQAIHVLETDSHDYKTLVLDTLDWAEPVLWRFICERDHKRSIEDYGYGKGYVAAIDEWRVLLHRLDALRDKKGMAVVLLGHAVIRSFKNPTGDDFDRYQMKMHEKSTGLVKEWADAVLFAAFETFTKKVDERGKAKGISTGARVVHTTRTAAFDAGNRYSMPEELPLSWSEIDAAIRAGIPRELSAMVNECKSLLAHDSVSDQDRAKGMHWLEKEQDPKRVAEGLDRLRAKVQLSEQAKDAITSA